MLLLLNPSRSEGACLVTPLAVPKVSLRLVTVKLVLLNRTSDTSIKSFPPRAGGAHPPLAVPKVSLRLGAARNFDRCAILTSLHRPQDALR